ncbi:hypothetical protein NQ318_015922 [Aromia moschata]|uniref:Cleavage and polyadenylation specificity factor subunit 2 n=1 Tax=Aromia moschata TaxID=1265417 RepID=A0AAV8XRX3_9CUCU|nr:hypothetical protein NQ318_015922 [Aromia moschata]
MIQAQHKEDQQNHSIQNHNFAAKLSKGKDAEVAWINAHIVIRENQADAKRMNVDNEPMDVDEDQKILTLEPHDEEIPHDPVFINELKLSEFKQVLAKSNITSEFSGGVLWCCNGSIAIRRVSLEIRHGDYDNDPTPEDYFRGIIS